MFKQQGRPRFALSGRAKERKGDILKESTRVELRGMLSVYQTPEAQERGQRRSKGWQCRRGRGYARMSQTRAAATLLRGGLPFPASGPSHSHAAPAPPWAPPASGTATTGLGSETDNFLLPDAQPGSNSPSTDEATSPRVAPSFRPTLLPLLPQTERAKPRRTRELSRYLESMGSCSLWRSVLSTQCSSDLGNLSQTTYLN